MPLLTIILPLLRSVWWPYRRYVSKGKGVLQPHRILDTLDEVQVSGGSAFAEGPFLDVLLSSQVSPSHRNTGCFVRARVSLNVFYASRVRVFFEQEAIVLPPFVAIAVRPRPGVWEYVRVNVHELNVEQLSVSEYLRFKEELVDGQYVLLPPVPSCYLSSSVCSFCLCYGQFLARLMLGLRGRHQATTVSSFA